MRKVGAPSMPKAIIAALTLLLLTGAGGESLAGTIVNERLPQDELLLDLIVRNSRDPDLLTARQSALQARLQNMGVDALLVRQSPDITTAAMSWMFSRARHDRWAPPRVRTERRWDRDAGLVISWEISEAVLFTDTVDTNVAGVVLRTPPPVDQPGVRTSIDDVDRLWRPAAVIEPTPGHDRAAARERWADALDRAAGWHADLSALDF